VVGAQLADHEPVGFVVTGEADTDPELPGVHLVVVEVVGVVLGFGDDQVPQVPVAGLVPGVVPGVVAGVVLVDQVVGVVVGLLVVGVVGVVVGLLVVEVVVQTGTLSVHGQSVMVKVVAEETV